jgi:tetratricopeptide (TPR) repeat protein
MLHTPPPEPPAQEHGETPPRPAQRPARRRYAWVLAVAAVLLVGLLFVLRPWLSEWLWPETRAQQLRQQATLALQAGRLTAADGSGARELYEAALALEPDRADAHAGLARVGQAALAQARAAIEKRRYPQAHAALRLARELDVPQAQVDALRERLREREAADAGLGRLLQRAAAAREAGRLDGSPDAALPLYQRVLELRPGQTVALEGREDVLTDLLRLARQTLARGELGTAAALIKRVRGADPGHVGLPDAIARLAEHVAERHRQAAADLQAGRLDAALAGYGALLVADPDDAEAARGYQRVAAAHARRSERLASDYRFDQAGAELDRAEALAPGIPEIAAAERHLERMRRSYARLRSNVSDPERGQRVAQLLEQAAAAEARGQLLAPPGESMFDRLRAARALAPGDPRVVAASARLLPAVRRCFDESLRSNDLGRAGSCLDALRALGGSNEVLRDLRRRLAQRWVAVGDQWLGAGQLADARRALQTARSLDPAAPGVAEFAARVQTAAPTAEPSR